MMSLVHNFFNRLFDWLFRVRTLGAQMLRYGVSLLIAISAADFIAKIAFRTNTFQFDFQLGTGGGLPELLTYGVTGLAIALIVGGIALLLRDDLREQRRQLIVVEVRGLHSSPDTSAKNAVKPAFRGQRNYVQVDFRPAQAGELVNSQRILDSVKGMTLHVRSAAQGRDMSDVTVAIGGIAAVPAMFLIGMRMDDESHVELYDWNRDLKSWNMIDGFDDGNRPRQLEIPAISVSDTEVVLAVSASYVVDDAAITATFPGLPIVRLVAEKIEANSYWAEEVQQAFATEFRKAVQAVMALQIKRIHLVLAAPASLTLRLGATYDERLHPELIVYQYERSSTPAYPWGIVLPHHGSPEPVIHHAPAIIV
jgi:SMODS-associated and fused to various effectors sensor domain/SAVED-fused 2TM effector domain